METTKKNSMNVIIHTYDVYFYFLNQILDLIMGADILNKIWKNI